MARHTIGLLLLVALAVLALGACDRAHEWQQESKATPLPEDPTALYPGEYRSEEFEPSLSFRVVEGWSNVPLEYYDILQIARGERARLAFTNVAEVYKPGTLDVMEAPRNLGGWFRHHPYLQTGKPEPVTVGGVKGVQFDVVVENLPEGYSGLCSRGVGPGHCVDLFRLRSGVPGGLIAFWEGDKQRVIILEDVGGETVTISFGSPATQFDEFALEAQRVLDSVEWRGA